MITDKTVIKIKGGMGNQMFQYAFGKALEAAAIKADRSLNVIFDTTAYTNPVKADTLRPYYLDILNTNATVANDAVALQARNPFGIASKITRIVAQKLKIGNVVAFKPSLLQPPYQGYYEGYWQSEKYFLGLSDQLRREFTLRNPLGDTAAAMQAQIAADPQAVSIFYRRTDYVGNSTFDIGEQDYQQNAINCMLELVPNARLYVMSDDISWVQQNANLPEGSVFVSSKAIPPEEEMVLASSCQHHIIPNSTFAWWGAWLGKNPNKIVIAPKKWANGNSTEYADIVPQSWVRV